MRREVIGDAVVYCGDCLEVLPELAGCNLDMVLTDPPFGCTECDWDEPVDLDAYWPLARAAVKLNAAHCIFCQMPFAGYLWDSNRKEFRYDLICRKQKASDFLNANRKPLRGHEQIFVFYRRLPTYNPQKTGGKPYRNKTQSIGQCYKTARLTHTNSSGDRYPLSIIPFQSDPSLVNASKPIVHNTQKNVHTVSWLVRTYTNEGEAILDPFMGSSSSGVAAIKTGRRFIGIERDQKWFDVACKRLEAAWQERGLLKDAANA